MALDVTISPEEVRALLEAGFLHRERVELDKARTIFEGLLALRPDLEAAHIGLANVLHAQGDTDAALASFQQAVSLSPNSANAHAHLGEFHYTQGRKDAAVQALDKAVELEPAGPGGEAARAIKALIDDGCEYTYGPPS